MPALVRQDDFEKVSSTTGYAKIFFGSCFLKFPSLYLSAAAFSHLGATSGVSLDWVTITMLSSPAVLRFTITKGQNDNAFAD